ncbi:MAG: transcription termination factor Rho [Euzebya sp.]
MDRSVLARKPMTELKDIASHLQMRGYQKLRKAELIDAIISNGTSHSADEASTPASDDDGSHSRSRTRSRTRGQVPERADREEADREEADREEADGQEADGQEEPRKVLPPPDPPGGDDDGENADEGDSANARKRRSRRDRRKRNRERPVEDTPADTESRGSGNDPGEVRAGVLDILPEGYGFLRTTGYVPGQRDVYVSQGQIRKHGLRRGDVVQGPIRPQRSNEKVPALHHVQKVNTEELEDGQVAERPAFEDLPLSAPQTRISLAVTGASVTARLVDLLVPLAQGQRALLIGPRHADTTATLMDLGQAVAAAAPDSHLMYVMVDARPEDVTAARAVITGEVISSTFDKTSEDHSQIAELAIERARRLVELGHDVVVVLDSITRLARSYGVSVQSGGRAIAPDLDAAALYPAKRFMASARPIEDGGSLTILASALTDTGSAVDDVIVQEMRRVANAEIVLDPVLARRRVTPPISVQDSHTREDPALHPAQELAVIKKLRRTFDGMDAAAATELVLDKLSQTDTNAEFLAQIQGSDLDESPLQGD